MKKNSLLVLIPFLFFACGSEKKENEKTNSSSEKEEISSDSTLTDVELVKAENDTNFVTGDIILQTSFGNQSDLVSIVTQSPFTHCGVIRKQEGNLSVIEANGTVRIIPLEEWIANGKDSKYVVMRFKNLPDVNSKENSVKSKMALQKFLNKPYDSKFMWSDDKIYCSELVWKLYMESLGLEVCPLKKLKDYDLSDASVQSELQKRYGDAIPLEEPMVAPSDIASSDQLVMIFSNY